MIFRHISSHLERREAVKPLNLLPRCLWEPLGGGVWGRAGGQGHAPRQEEEPLSVVHVLLGALEVHAHQEGEN